jgi:glycosyltransferase involved in cell wall biosynthesis
MADFSDFVKELNSVINTSQGAATASTATTAATTVAPSNTTVSEPQKSVKILIVSTHTNQYNGYSKVVHNLIQQLANHNWIKIVHFGTQKMVNADLGRKYPSGVKVIDGSALEKQKQTGFAFSELPGVINSEKPDIVFIYNDISIICTYIEEIRKTIQSRFFKIWAYIDTTYNPQPQPLIDIINRDVERIFVFTKGWKEAIKAQGATRPIDVMNHGYDNKMIRPIPKELARQSLGLPKDVFLITSLNKNIPRKRLDLLVMAFVKIIIRFPMKPIFMLIVADKGDRSGYQIFDIFSREILLTGASLETFGNRLLVTSKDTCYKDDDINILNNCGDIGVSCAEGEGFGLCSFEQMVLGIPQIVPNINGYNEYCNNNNSIMVDPKVRLYMPVAYNIVGGQAQLVDPEDVAKAIERYIFEEELRKHHAKQARESVANFTWEKVTSVLIKRLEAVQKDDD